MYIIENSEVEIQFWNIYLKTNVSLSQQQNKANWARSKLASCLSYLGVADLLQTVFSTGYTPRKLSTGRMKIFRGPHAARGP